jgi:hypothetical protein
VSAIQTLLQASEYYPEENEVEYRLAGLYFMIQRQYRKQNSFE